MTDMLVTNVVSCELVSIPNTPLVRLTLAPETDMNLVRPLLSGSKFYDVFMFDGEYPAFKGRETRPAGFPDGSLMTIRAGGLLVERFDLSDLYALGRTDLLRVKYRANHDGVVVESNWVDVSTNRRPWCN